MLTILIALMGVAAEGRCDPPMVSYAFPAGGQRGSQVATRVGGCNLYASPKLYWSDNGIGGPSALSRIETIWYEGPLIPQPASQQREDYPRDYSAPLTIDPAASLGRHSWRLATSQGVTSGWGFIVGEFPEVVEIEEEGEVPAVAVSLPVTINGRIFPREDVDAWKFSATAGQVVTCHVATSSFGSPLDARLALTDGSGRVLAESLPAGDVTPPLRFTIPATGEYQVRIHDVSFAGLQNHVYRLTLTTGPVLDAVYPLGGRRGHATRFQLDGANLTEPEVTYTLPATGATTVFRLSQSEISFGDVPLELDDFEELLEPESTSPDMIPKPFTAPCILNGRIQVPGEDDVWKFKAVKGQEFDFDVHAARCGSPLDAVIALHDSAGKMIQEADDSPGLQSDARLRWAAPEDGEFQFRIRDRLLSRGGRRFAYRVRVISADTPEFTLKLAADSMNIEQGQSANVKVMLDRGPGFKEPVQLVFDELPSGLTITSPTVIAANQQEIQVTLKADQTAKLSTTPVRVTGIATIGERQIKQSAGMPVPSTAQGQDSLAIIDPNSPLWISMTLATPFKFVGAFESKYVPRGGAYVRKYRIDRNGFEGPIEVELADRQGRHLQGVTAQSVVVPANQNEFEFAVNLPSWMEVGRTCRSTLAISAVTKDADGNSHTISYSSNDQHNQMIALVATGRLTVQLPRSTLVARPGQRMELPIRILRSPGITGPVTLDLGVSKSAVGVLASPVTIESNQNAGTLILEFGNELKGISVHPLVIRATTQDERQLPITAEVRLSLVDIVNISGGDVRE